MSRLGRIRAGLLTAAIVALLPAGPVLAVNPARAEPPSAGELYQQLGIDETPADYVVLIDMSASMREGGLYDGVRRSLREFAAALAPKDRLSLVSFADDARLIWQGPVGRNPDAIVGRLPANPTGRHTDIGTGIAEAVRLLERPGGAPIAGVVLLTDGQHDPGPGSPYPFTAGFAWRELAARAGRLPQQVIPMAVQLRGTNGAPLLRKVFPRATVLRSASIDQLTDRLALAKQGIQAAKAQALLTGDRSAEVRVEWPTVDGGLRHGVNRIPLTLHSTSRHIPVEVSGLAVRGDTPAVSSRLDVDRVTIPPGGTVRVPVTLTWDAGPTSWQPLHTVEARYRLTLEARLGSPWSDTLTRDLKVDFAPVLAGTTTTVRASAQRGSPGPWTLAAAALVALGLAAAVVWWRRMHPVPGGTLTASAVDAAGADGSCPLRQHRTVISAGSLGVPGAGSVIGRRRAVASLAVHLLITYSRDGSLENRRTGACTPDEPLELHGIRFEWHPSGRPASSTDAAGDPAERRLRS